GWGVGTPSMAAMSPPPGSGSGPGGHDVGSAPGVILRGAVREHERGHRSDPPVRPAHSGTPSGHDVLGRPSELSIVQNPADRQTGRRRTAQFAARAGSVPVTASGGTGGRGDGRVAR